MEPELRSMSLAYRLTLWQRIWRIVLPFAPLQVFTGARTALVISFIVMVISELARSRQRDRVLRPADASVVRHPRYV